MQPVQAVTTILSLLTIVGDVVIIGGVLLWILSSSILSFFPRKAILFSFIVALIATLGSLFFSEIAGFEPCKLCWFQRILMYPQVILLAIAFLKKDKNIADYSIALSTIGAVIAAYHYYLQVGGTQIFPCSTVGYSVSCSQKFILQFGYITIPMMSLTAFLLILFFMINKKMAASE